MLKNIPMFQCLLFLWYWLFSSVSNENGAMVSLIAGFLIEAIHVRD